MSHPVPTLAAHLAHYPELAEHAKGWRHPFDAQTLRDKVILVTGAGDGLGAATAKTYASFGATVVLLGRTRSKLEAVNDWISTNTATQPVIVPCDLETLDMETANNLAHSIGEAFGRLDGIVHHASRLGPRAPLAHYALDEWLKVMQTNVNATFLLNQTLFNLLDTSARACIVHTSSSVGRVGTACRPERGRLSHAQPRRVSSWRRRRHDALNLLVFCGYPCLLWIDLSSEDIFVCIFSMRLCFCLSAFERFHNEAAQKLCHELGRVVAKLLRAPRWVG